MHDKLYWNTVTPSLRQSLDILMAAPIFDAFRLVGGTALSLQLGHRVSIDIDLFTAEPYGSVDFDAIDAFLRGTFNHVSVPVAGPAAMGRSYYIGSSEDDSVKLDLYYTEAFIRPLFTAEHIRMATKEEIAAMKMDIVQRGGRKKDFWDIHELLDEYSPAHMIALHAERYPYAHDEAAIRTNFTDFSRADEDFDPDCLRGKYWEMVKFEIAESMTR